MPVRYITTRLAIEGEREYRAAVTNINSELKLLDSELKLVASQFKENANSQEALTAKGDTLQKMYDTQAEKVKALKDGLQNAGTAAEGYANKSDELRKAIEANNQKLNELKNSSGDTAAEQQKLTEENGKLSAELERSNKSLDVASKTVNSWQTDLNKAEANLNDLSGELDKNNKYLDEAKNSVDGTAHSIDQYGKNVEEASEKNQKFEQGIDALAATLIAAGVQRTFGEIEDALMSCVDASVEFESAFAGVKKTIDATDAQLEILKTGIKEMALEIPASTTEIAGVAEAAGQLGIATDDIMSFTRVMVDLGVATNLSSDQAASALAKFANITKMSADDYDRLGSVIVDLGNKSATTEADIVSMAMRLASTGDIVGLSEPQIMAVATALSSVGINAEAGGSAISKLLKQIEVAVKTYETATKVINSTGYSMRELELLSSNSSMDFKAIADSIGYTSKELNDYIKNAKKLEQFAEISGKSAKDFIQAWGDDAVIALDSFITGLSGLEGSGTSAVEILNDMGLTEIRLSNAVLALASSNGILTKSVNIANEAWEENTALAKEAEQRYATTESKFQIFKNSVDGLKVSIGDDLNPALGKLADAGTNIVGWATDFINKNSAIVPGITAIVVALGIFTGAITATAAALKIYAMVQALAFPATGVAVAGILALVAAIGTLAVLMPDASQKNEAYYKSLEEANAKTQALIQSSKDLQATYKEQTVANETNRNNTLSLIDDLQRLSAIENKSSAEKELLLKTVINLNNAIPELSLSYDRETDSLISNTGEVLKNADAIMALFETRMKQEEYELASQKLYDSYKKKIELEKELTAAEERAAEATIKNNEIISEAAAYRQGILSTLGGFLAVEGLYASKYQEALKEASEGSVKTAAAVYDLEQQISETEKAIRESKNIVNEIAGTTDQATNSTNNYSEAQKNNTQSTYQSAEAQKALSNEYQNTYEAARESADGQKKLLESQEKQTERTVDDILHEITRLDNVRYLYEADRAVAAGFNQNFVKLFEDGTERSMKSLHALMVKYNDMVVNFGASSDKVKKFVDEYNSGFEKSGEAFVETIKDMETALDKSSDKMLKTAKDFSNDFPKAITPSEKEVSQSITTATTQGVKSGINQSIKDIKSTTINMGLFVTQGISKGIMDGTSEVGKAMAYMSSAMEKSFKDTNLIKSPSKKYAQLAGYIPEGVSLGIMENLDVVKKAMAEMSDSMKKAYENSGINQSMFEIPDYAYSGPASGAGFDYGSASDEHGGDTYNLYFDTVNFKDLESLIRIAKDKRVKTRMGYEE